VLQTRDLNLVHSLKEPLEASGPSAVKQRIEDFILSRIRLWGNTTRSDVAERLLEPSPTDKQTLIRMRILDGTYQSLKGWLIGNDVARLDLNNEAGGLKAKTAAPGDDVDALVRTGRRDLHSATLGLQDFRDKPGKIGPGERTRDTPLDLIPRDLVKIDLRLFSGWGFRNARARGGVVALPS
jgi:hypothetical protein